MHGFKIKNNVLNMTGINLKRRWGGGKVIKTLRKLHTKSTMAENMKAKSINILRLINTFFYMTDISQDLVFSVILESF